MRTKLASSSLLLAGALFGGGANLFADTTLWLRHELLALGDFNGDGRVDFAVIDRESGQFRSAQFSSAGVPVWGGPFQSGIAPADGAATGRMLSTSRDALALSGESTNRANVFDLTSLSDVSAPLSLFAPQVGPSGVVAAQMNGSASALAEAALFYTDNGFTPQARTLFAFSGLPVTAASFHTANPATLQVRPRKIDGFTAAYGAFIGAKPTDTFRVVDLATAGYPELASLTGLPFNAECVHADFDATGTTSPAQFVFYVRGNATLSWSRLRASNVFDPLDSTGLGSPIEQVCVVPRFGGGFALLVAFTDGAATLYSFDGTSTPAALQTFAPQAGAPWTAAVPFGAGDFWLLASPGGTTNSATRFTWNGSTHAANGTSTPPALTLARATSNVFAFTADPLTTDGAQLLGTFSAGDWSRTGSLSGGNLRAERARFVSSSAGLGTFNMIVIGPAPAGTGHVLTNQLPSGEAGVASYASAFGPSAALGLNAGDITVSPEPGHYTRAVKPVLTAPSGVQVYWRLGNTGAWTSLTVQPPPWQYESFTLSFHGRTAGGVTTPVRSVEYDIDVPASELDSDRDGVPDFVELAYGLDPVASGADADGDGASDLAEILSGTNPFSAASFPTRPDGPAGAAPLFEANYEATFSLRVTPTPVAGTSRYATIAARGGAIHAHEVGGTPLASANVSSFFGYATLSGIPGAFAGSFWAIGTDEHFNITGGRARELVGLVPVPAQELGAVPYVHGGGSLATEAAAWRTAALAHYSAPTSLINETLDTTDTLVLLLTEMKLEQILRARGELGVNQTLSLTPWRATETTVPFAQRATAAADARIALAPEDLFALRRYAGAYSFGWLAETIRSRIALDLGTPPNAGVTRLLTIAREFYYLSTAATDEQLPAFPAPVDALRKFLRTGVVAGDLDSDGVRDLGETQGYWPTAALTPAEFSEGYGAVVFLLGRPAPRPASTATYVVTATTFDGPVPVLNALVGGAPAAFLEADGDAFPLSSAFDLAAGAELLVQAFTDVTSPAAPAAREVITIQLTSLPAVVAADVNGDLLGDAWASYFLTGTTGGTFGDDDGDGFSNLEEYLNATDPKSGLSLPTGSPVDLKPPQVVVKPGGASSELLLEFQFPAGYAERFAFHLQTTASLASPYTEPAQRAVHQGSGLFRTTLTVGPDAKRFWRFRMALK